MSTAEQQTVRRSGLTSAEVAERVAQGRTNRATSGVERSLAYIIRANVLTRVNGIMFTLFVLIIAAGYWRDGLFVGVVVSNSIIGIVQEVKARRELARLRVLSAPRATVVRDGSVVEVAAEDVVIDDLLALRPGDQIIVDGELVDSAGLELDESLLTGESDPVAKVTGDEVRSGSFVVSGSGACLATAVGDDSFAAGLASQAQEFTLVDSELQRSINRILGWLVPIIPIASILLFWSQYDEADSWQDAMQGTVAAAVAMVPDGLVLLTSLAFMAGVIALARRNALAKQLATVEVLARVDVLCLDKTGTITTGELSLEEIAMVDGVDRSEVLDGLAALVASEAAPNATLAAIAAGSGEPPGWTVVSTQPFSSARKWSSATFDGHGTWMLGAPDVLLAAGAHDPDVVEWVRTLSRTGTRVVLLAHSPSPIVDQHLPEDLSARAVITLHDTPRSDAAEIIGYFHDQEVHLKVISGDDVDTVSAVAERVGIERTGSGTDARQLPVDTEELAAALDADTVFGRVVPEQKRQMVEALQSRGHVVGMTGDGVNDVLALKRANLGIAMGTGSAATRSVADLVLLDSRFATLPTVVAEGRKVINNVERVANLFVSKAAYAVLLTIVVACLSVPFPLLPRQLTLVGTFSIGVPGFFLALAPEQRLVRPGFLSRVLQFSLPAGCAAGLMTFVAYQYARNDDDVDLTEARTLATITLLAIGLVILVVTSRPLRPWKALLAAAMAASYLVICLVPFARDYFELEFTDVTSAWVVSAVGVAVAATVIVLVPRLMPGLDRTDPRAPEPSREVTSAPSRHAARSTTT